MEQCEYCGKETKSLAGLKLHYRFCEAAKETLNEEPEDSEETEEIGDPTGFTVNPIGEQPKETVVEVPISHIADKGYLDKVIPTLYREITDNHARRAMVQERPNIEGLPVKDARERLLRRSEIARIPYAVDSISQIMI